MTKSQPIIILSAVICCSLFSTVSHSAVSGQGLVKLLEQIDPTHKPVIEGTVDPIDFFHKVIEGIAHNTDARGITRLKGAIAADIPNTVFLQGKTIQVSPSTQNFALLCCQKGVDNAVLEHLSTGAQSTQIKHAILNEEAAVELAQRIRFLSYGCLFIGAYVGGCVLLERYCFPPTPEGDKRPRPEPATFC